MLNIICALLIYCLLVTTEGRNFTLEVKGRKAAIHKLDCRCKAKTALIDMDVDFQQQNFTSSIITMNYTMFVAKNIDNPFKIVLKFGRCKIGENSCDNFHGFATSHLCKMINSKAGLWGNFFRTSEPPLQCPVRMGTYTSLESNFDVANVLSFPLKGYIFTIRTSLVDLVNRNILACCNVDLEILN